MDAIARGHGGKLDRRAVVVAVLGACAAFALVGVALFLYIRPEDVTPATSYASPECRELWFDNAVLFAASADLALAALVAGGLATWRTGRSRWLLIALPVAALLGAVAVVSLDLLALSTGDSISCWSP